MLEKRPPYLPNKLHANHPRQPFPEPAKAQKEATLAQPPGGSELDAKTTPQGVTIARDFTSGIESKARRPTITVSDVVYCCP